jgi:hypothetical protein
MHRAIRTELFTAIQNLALALIETGDGSWAWLQCRYIGYRTPGGLNNWRGSKALEPHNAVWKLHHLWGLHYVGAWLGPPTVYPLHRASETDTSQQVIEPGTSCTAGEHSMQRAIWTALLAAIRNLCLYYYTHTIKLKILCCFDFCQNKLNLSKRLRQTS